MGWTRGRIIGRGSSATVSVATVQGSDQVVALKSAQLSDSEFLQREHEILSAVKCPNIIGYQGCNVTVEDQKVMYNLCIEFAPRGSVRKAIRDQVGGLDEDRIRYYSRAILNGLVYLHSQGIVHCDIKCDNVLVTDEGVKIADFGCAKYAEEVPVSGSLMAGTPAFMAPEVARGEEQKYPADIWALGCTIIEMATGRPPWTDVTDPVSALYKIGFSGNGPEIPKFLSEQAKDFLGKCLQRDPSARCSALELLDHEFLIESGVEFKESFMSNSITPTSILDQGLWDSMDNVEQTHNSARKASNSGSPLDRMKQLMNLDSSPASDEFEGSWITVRGNGLNEADDSVCCRQEFEMLYDNDVTSSVHQESFLQVSEDNLLINIIDPFRMEMYEIDSSDSNCTMIGISYEEADIFLYSVCKIDCDSCAKISIPQANVAGKGFESSDKIFFGRVWPECFALHHHPEKTCHLCKILYLCQGYYLQVSIWLSYAQRKLRTSHVEGLMKSPLLLDELRVPILENLFLSCASLLRRKGLKLGSI